MKGKFKSILKIGIVLIIIAIAAVYFIFLTANTVSNQTLYISRADKSSHDISSIALSKLISNQFSFKIACKIMGLHKILPGKYEFKAGMNNRTIINKLKYGKQDDQKLRLGTNLFPNEIAGIFGKKLDDDSATFQHNFDSLMLLNGLTEESFMSHFLADTYFLPWSYTPSQVWHFFLQKQESYWNNINPTQLGNTGLKNKLEVYTLASIIEKEVMSKSEFKRIAGVYINRLKITMPLQSDPTSKYAAGIKFMKRVKGILDIESPYNTYKITGLPPGPIGLASTLSLDAVLNFEKHDYLYFCAKPDNSGTHNFAKTYSEHLVNVGLYRIYQQQKGIK